jgi:uncharacterized protein (TIGR00730 family)
MAELADGFLVLPGGVGTMDETFEILTWAVLGLHAKPIGLVDVDGYYQPIMRHIEHMVESGFVSAKNAGLLAIDPDPAVLLGEFTRRLGAGDRRRRIPGRTIPESRT